MAEYISREDVLDIASQYCSDDDGSCSKADVDLRKMLDEIEALPAVYVQPVKHGRWLPAKGWFMSKCSECGYELGMVLAAGYICCPKCTARMDGDSE